MGTAHILYLQTDFADALPRFSQSSQSLRDASRPYRNIYLCRLVLRFLDFLSGMLTKYLLNARFQNSDYVFRQLKPGIIFVRHAAKKVTKPRKSRRAKIYNFLFGRLAMSPKLRIIKSEKRWQRNKSATKVKSTIYAQFPWRRGYKSETKVKISDFCLQASDVFD